MSADNGYLLNKRKDGKYTLQHFFMSSDIPPDPEKAHKNDIFNTMDQALAAYGRREWSEYGLIIGDSVSGEWGNRQLEDVARLREQVTRASVFPPVEKQPEWSKDLLKEDANLNSDEALDVLRKKLTPQDEVNHPSHYTQYKGLEVIDLTEQLNFNRGSAVKYIARAGYKSKDTEIQDLEKAAWYINREIGRIGGKVTTHDKVSEQTIYTVYAALVKSGLTDEQADDAVNMMQNKGILFRERS